MKVNYLSEKPYIPMYLSSGADAVLVDYTGNPYMGGVAHGHTEQHAGIITGWYKPSNRTESNYHSLTPDFSFGMPIILFGANAEPDYFEQEFIPEKATLITELRFAKSIKLKITDFINADGIFCQTAEVLQNPENYGFDIIFEISKAVSPFKALRFNCEYDFSAMATDNQTHTFKYQNGNDSGFGFMYTDTPYDELKKEKGIYKNVSEGFKVTRFITAVDTSERFNCEEVYEKRFASAKSGIEKLTAAHNKYWGEYFNTSFVTTDNEAYNYIYNVSRYIMKANQHPSGRIGLGNLPNLWGGGIYDTYDEEIAQRAMLSCGNLKEGEAFINAYADASNLGKKALSEAGIKGTAFAGWDNCFGGFQPNGSFFRYVTEYKPCMSMLVLHCIYWQYRYDKASFTNRIKEVTKDIIAFFLDYIIKENDGKYYLKEVSAGNEAGFLVKVDTFNQWIAASGFRYAAEMLGVPEYVKIADSLREGINQNFKDGVLYPFDDANYTGTYGALVSPFMFPEKSGEKSIEAGLIRGETPFGVSGDQTTEEYLDWPWFNWFAVSAFTNIKCSDKAEKYLLNMDRYTSSLGAIPEKLRLDGFRVGYYYTTSHAMFVTAINDALALFDGEELLLSFGFKDLFKNYTVDNLHVSCGLVVSYSVQNGELKNLTVKNTSDSEISFKINFKDKYVKDVTLSASEEFSK